MKSYIGQIIIIAVFAAIIAGFGIAGIIENDVSFSELENRNLAEFPAFSPEAVFSGIYTNSLDSYISDHFPRRMSFIEATRRLDGFYCFDAGLIAEVFKSGKALPFENPTPNANTAEPAETNTVSPAPPSTETSVFEEAESSETPPPSKQYFLTTKLDPGASPESLNSLVLLDSFIMEKYIYSEEKAIRYAGLVNKLTDECGVKSYVIMPTPAAELYLDHGFISGATDRDTISERLRELLSGPELIDLSKVLAEHKNEYIYFRTDHHWTQTGAYYAYRELCRAMNLDCPELWDYKFGHKPGFLGSLYKSIFNRSEAKILEANPDDVPYYIPVNNTVAENYKTYEMTDKTEKKLIYPENSGYSVYMGEEMFLGYIHSPVRNGKSIMIVRDSYGHCFVPFLADSFEYVYFIEPRYFEDGFKLAEFVKEKGIETLVFLNYELSALGNYWMDWSTNLEKLTAEYKN